jgi:hypothetical protein
MPAQSTQPQIGAALDAMRTIGAAMAPDEYAEGLFAHSGTVVVMLGSRHAWAAWFVEVRRIADSVHAQASLHVATAEAVVCGCPVMLVCGDCPPDVPPCTCVPGRHAVAAADRARVEAQQALASPVLEAYYGAVLAPCPTSIAASAMAVAS